jgi:hypothetical protein
MFGCRWKFGCLIRGLLSLRNATGSEERGRVGLITTGECGFWMNVYVFPYGRIGHGIPR